MEKEKIYLTEEEFDEVRTDKYSDGSSWDIVVKRESDGKFFKWNCWAGKNYSYRMQGGNNYMTEVFPESITKIIYK